MRHLWQLLLLTVVCLSPGTATAGALRIEIDHRWGDGRLALGDPVRLPGLSYPLTVSRCDYLLSGFAVQGVDGGWLEADPGLVGLIRLGKGITTIDLGEIPAGDYRAFRFSVGLGEELNAADPNRFPPGHALHPQRCGLHWSWQGGYIFLALEGRYGDGGRGDAGFAYHLARDANRVEVLVELPFEMRKRVTLNLAFDLRAVFRGAGEISPGRGRDSTHSREGDPVLPVLRDNLAGAFRGLGARGEFFHPAPTAPEGEAEGPAPHGNPFRLRVSQRLPRFALPPDNPLTEEGVALGRRLFEEPLLSRDGKISCASCHRRELAFADGRKFALGVGGAEGTRNSMALFNLAWAEGFFWDGHAPSLRQQVLEPIRDPDEMGESLARVIGKLIEAEGYPEAFQAAFGGRAVTPDRIAKALEQFLLSLVSQDSKFDRAMRGEAELTEGERRGFQLFVTENDPALGLRGADCFHCHGGGLFVSAAYANNGLPLAPGEGDRSTVTGDPADRGKFKVPSLRNIAVTAPYMHDGRFATLEEVVEHYDSGVRRTPELDPNLAKHPPGGLGLSAQDKRDLVAFLKTLTDPVFLGVEAGE